MRSSTISKSQRVYRACEATTRRNFTTGPASASRPAPTSRPACEQCLRQISNQRRPVRGIQSRFHSSSASSSTPASPTSAPKPQTHYELFPQTLPRGPPPSGPFKIDVRALRREFLQLQAKAHPDRHAHENKTRAEATSAYINEAFKTLSNPLLRAQYLLSLRGIDVAEDEALKVDDEALLGMVLEAREEIEEAEHEEELEPLRKTNEERIEMCERRLEAAFAEQEEGGLQKAKEEAVRLRYWVNIRESLDAWEKGKPVVLVH
ncbi:hypothetical protein BP6252_02048 [Coleophoma cylindrospora]|uniref:J domain-containing protein n=1 Tax=Coleophoma cylindrospora TaxID=1849047 RepID=A0A3D8SFC3_9HELO|nr:hypothetical protein BP6252_02048 [Coleophoma cylindrospora]